MDVGQWSRHPLIGLIEKGMTVLDAAGEPVGTVEDVGMGDPSADTTQGNRPQVGMIGAIAEGVTGRQPEPDVPGPMRDQLLRYGFVKIDGPGLFHTNRYVRSDRIASVTGDTVTLTVRKDDLPKEPR